MGSQSGCGDQPTIDNNPSVVMPIKKADARLKAIIALLRVKRNFVMKGFYVGTAVDLWCKLSCLKEVLECDLSILHQRGMTAPKLLIKVI